MPGGSITLVYIYASQFVGLQKFLRIKTNNRSKISGVSQVVLNQSRYNTNQNHGRW